MASESVRDANHVRQLAPKLPVPGEGRGVAVRRTGAVSLGRSNEPPLPGSGVAKGALGFVLGVEFVDGQRHQLGIVFFEAHAE
jgi:hypothetical protein